MSAAVSARKSSRVEIHAPERVVCAGVEPAGDDDELGPERAQGREHDALEGQAVGGDAAARRERDVEVRAARGAFAHDVDAASARRVVLVLVERDREHARVAVGRSSRCRCRDARPSRRPRSRPTPRTCARGGSRCRCSRTRRSPSPSPARRDARAAARARRRCRPRRRARRRRPRWCRPPRAPRSRRRTGPSARPVAGVAARRAERAHVCEVRRGVDAQDLLVGGRPRAQLHELVEQAGDVEQVAEAALRLGVLERSLRLHVGLERRRREVVPGARVVPGVALLPQPTSRHAGDSTGDVAAHSVARMNLPALLGGAPVAGAEYLSLLAPVGRARARGIAGHARIGRVVDGGWRRGPTASHASSLASRAPRPAIRSRTGRRRWRPRWWPAASARATR